MATTTTMYDVQKKELMEYYDKMSDVIESHKRTYTKLVEKLNKPTCGGNIMNKTLDKFMGSVLPPFNDFSDDIMKHPFTENVEFMYDLNKKTYIDVIDLPERYIIKEFNIDIHTFTSGFHNIQYLFQNKYNVLQAILNCHTINYSILHNSHYGNGRKPIYTPQKYTIKFIIDNYCNIYIPHLELYILNNYSKFNLYSFYNSNKIFNFNNINNYIIYDNTQPEQKIKSDLNYIFNTLKLEQMKTSEDTMMNFIKTYLQTFLQEIKYSEMNDAVIPYLDLSERFTKIIPQDFETLIIEDEDMVDGVDKADELQRMSILVKKLTSELDIKNKEIDLLKSEYLKSKDEVSSYEIQNHKLKKVCGELNDRILENISEISELQTENLGLKQECLDSDNLKSEIEKSKSKIDDLVSEINISEKKLEKKERFIALSQEKLNRYIKQSKSDTKLLDVKVKKISKLNKRVQDKDSLILDMKTSNEKIIIDYQRELKELNDFIKGTARNIEQDGFMEHIVEQNQEYTDKISSYESIILEKNQEIKEIRTEYRKYKSNIKKLILETN